ncbi:4-hydroxythreonine-4-phosphate dehydrogenase PdxA [bacterium]|nr:4-hydroxythreonine-4-phosphate dehydrogenase PdxA [bacterium]
MLMLVVTPGEPAGIGPDLLVRFAQNRRECPMVVAADADMLTQRARLLSMPLEINDNLQMPSCEPGRLSVVHCPLAQPAIPGVLDPANVPGVLGALDGAIAGCLQGRYSGLVTGPMQKSVVNDAGVSFIGHTEYLAAASNVEDVVMLLVAGDLRVALATTHLPLSQVPSAVTSALLMRRLQILHQDLQTKFLCPNPKILVAGLNPHAGESGHLGGEEIEVITPVIEALQSRKYRVVGPLPADTLFTPQYLSGADAVMCMYHDQGLPVLKFAGFGEAVNVTLGLPFVRTSVDHGTALDKAGGADVSVGSFTAAVNLAAQLSQL